MSPPASPSGCLCRVPHSRSIVVAAVSASASVLSCLHDRSSLKESRIMLFADVRLLALEHASAVRRPFAAGAPRLRSSLASPGATLVPRAAADVSVGTSYSTEPAYAEAPVGVGEARPCLPTNQAVPGAPLPEHLPEKVHVCVVCTCRQAHASFLIELSIKSLRSSVVCVASLRSQPRLVRVSSGATWLQRARASLAVCGVSVVGRRRSAARERRAGGLAPGVLQLGRPHRHARARL